MKILLVEEDVNTLDVSAYALRREGFNVLTARTAAGALSLGRSAHPHVVVASVRLPDMSGFELCQRVRHNWAVPVILLTEQMDDEHVVRGYQVGADDVVAKPFSMRQLAMRVRAVWRAPETPGDPEPQREVRAGSITLDVDAYEVRRDGRATHLTPIEFRLLYLLAMNAERVVSSARLLEYAWKHDEADALLLRTHICRIRNKLRLPRGRPGDIFSLPGVGYRLTVDAAPPAGQPVAAAGALSMALPHSDLPPAPHAAAVAPAPAPAPAWAA
jgi:DNA-binding response OmpR family regulator